MKKKDNQRTDELFNNLTHKAHLKQLVYHNTFNGLRLLKETMKYLTDRYEHHKDPKAKEIPFVFTDRSDFEAELKLAGDTLVFMMHTNVFEFSREHEVRKTPYIKEDKDRSYCGIINIFNFLSDSFKYNRVNDIGYLIVRVFINKDKHYFFEGKKEIGYLYNNFGDSILDLEAVQNIIEAAIKYTINFDLLTPPYDNMKEVTVQEFKTALDSMRLKTGKRLGFKFQADVASPGK